jgi:hypothetical protein
MGGLLTFELFTRKWSASDRNNEKGAHAGTPGEFLTARSECGGSSIIELQRLEMKNLMLRMELSECLA